MKIYYYKSLVQNMFLNKIDEVVSHKRVACTIINGLCQQSGGFFVPFFTFFFFFKFIIILLPDVSETSQLRFMEEMSYVLTKKNVACVPVGIYILFLRCRQHFSFSPPQPINVLNFFHPKKSVSFGFLSFALTFSLLSTTGGRTLT